MAGLSHFWTERNVFQAAGTIVSWTWKLGEEQDYWGFCVRPFQANSDVAVSGQFTTTDNDLNCFEHFTVSTTSGGLIRFSAIRVAGS
jgi:hypothetical protein